MDTPAAEIDIDAELVRSLLAEQHPDLADRDLRLVANGWDNAILRLGDDLVVRLPRRAAAAKLIEHEQRWLPEIASRVRIPVPVPVRVGLPGEGFPWSWTIAEWFDGDRASSLSHDSLRPVAGALADFVRELHVVAPVDAPFNPVRGIPLAVRADAVDERLASGLVPNPQEIAHAWHAALTAPVWRGGPVWLHGDLHPANILIRGDALAAVIDFGDVCSGDPATDLATAWLTFDATGRAAFLNALGYDEATWARARGWAILLGNALVSFSADNPALMAIGRHALEQVLLG
jgi:aminoglycoside phosphotransferase (APT) family kinase protein